MLKNEVTIQDICNLFNELLKLDYDCIQKLVACRVKCNDAIANHPTVQVTKSSEVGIIGIINGLFGIDDNGFGPFCAELDDNDKIICFKPTSCKNIVFKEKVKQAFLKQPKGSGIYPKGPLKIVDDPLSRCFRIYDGDDVEFLSISVVEKQQLPEEIKKYFNMKSPQRETTAVKEVSQHVDIRTTDNQEVFANEIVESLRQWAFTDIPVFLKSNTIEVSLKASMIAIYSHCTMKDLNDYEKLFRIKSTVERWLNNGKLPIT